MQSSALFQKISYPCGTRALTARLHQRLGDRDGHDS